MKQITKLRKIINQTKEIINRNPIEPNQLRYVFKIVRTELGLIVPKIPQPLPRYMTPGEIYHFLQCADEIDPKFRLFAELLIVTGLRVNEARHIMLSDFKDNNQIHVRIAKFKKERFVPYTNSLHHKVKLYMGQKKNYLWTNSKNKLVSKRTLQRWIERIVLKSGLSGVHTHTLRHTYACLMLSKGIRIEALKTLMGHSSIKTTEIYGRLELGDIKQQYLQFMGDL